MATSGVIHIEINNKKMDTGRFLYNMAKEEPKDVQAKLLKKVEDFFKWYSSFQNKQPISKLSIHSSDFVCMRKCNIPINSAISVIGIVFKGESIGPMLTELGQKYGIEIQIDLDNL